LSNLSVVLQQLTHYADADAFILPTSFEVDK